MGLDCLAARDGIEFPERDEVSAAELWYGKGYRGSHIVCNWVLDGECFGRTEVYVPEQAGE